MRFGVWLGAAAVALWGSAASAAMVITADIGGSMRQYEERYAQVRDSGERVVIDGLCLSACTMVLGMVPRERLCVTPNALLGFHAAWYAGMDGDRIISPSHTQKLQSIYPVRIRNWIAKRGGLSSQMMFLQGRELRAIVPPCKTGAAARAERSPSGHNLEISASAKALAAGL